MSANKQERQGGRQRKSSRPRFDGSSRAGRWLRRARIASQVVLLGIFIFLILHTEFSGAQVPTGAELRIPYPTSLFLEADPLVGLATVLATGNLHGGLIWGAAVLVLSLVLGRVFCGWVCPMGTLQQLSAWVTAGVRRVGAQIRGNRYSPGMRWKYYALVALLVASLFTTVHVGLIDPICLLFRSLGLSIIPAVDELARGALEALQRSDAHWVQRTADVGLALRARVLPVHLSRIEGAWILGALLGGVLVGAAYIPRLWCRWICPLGALLGLSARTSLLQLRKDEDRCTGCNRCLATCQGACEPAPGKPWRAAECVMCFNCEAVCPDDALHFGVGGVPATGRVDADLDRRAVFGAAVAGAVALPLLRSSAGFPGRRGEGADPHLIRPPGALPEEDFLARCVKCGACMKVCPTNALHPSWTKAGAEGLWTPILVPRIGYCEPSCTLCSQVCPTGAIAPLTEARKTGRDGDPPIKLGTAFYDRGRCLPWAMETPCIVCEEWCPTSPKSIHLTNVQVTRRDATIVDLQRPSVDPERCIGCGSCEHACPVSDLPAVRVSRVGESRHPQARLLLRG